MDDVIKVGDTICCHDYADMMNVMNELMKQGYIATAQVGYVVRIESVPVARIQLSRTDGLRGINENDQSNRVS